jgi:hypothetical protein
MRSYLTGEDQEIYATGSRTHRNQVVTDYDVSKVDGLLCKDVLDVALRLIWLCKEMRTEISLVAEFFNEISWSIYMEAGK